MKKILLLTQNYYPSVGGGIRYKVDFVEIFRSSGFQVDILCTNTENTLLIEQEVGGKVTRTPLNLKAGSTSISFSTFKFFKEMVNSYDYLHFNFPSPFTDMSLLLFNKIIKQNIAISCYYHADVVPEKTGAYLYNKFITSNYLKRIDKIFVSNPTIIESSPHLKAYKSKVQVIPFGINPQTHFFSENKNLMHDIGEGYHQSTQTENPRLNVLFVGRLSRYKGVDLLIKACMELDINLDIVGTGPLDEELKGLSKGSIANIQFHGFVPNSQLPGFYTNADVFILPSIDEGEAFGYVLIEAMLFSCALISTEVGTGTSWVNQDRSTGLVIDPKNINAIKDSVQYMKDNPDKLSSFKKASQKRFLESFSFESMKSKLVSSLV